LNYIRSEAESDGNGVDFPSSDNTSLSRIRILVVDDDADIAFTFKIGLELNGFHVEVFNDPREALYVFKPNYYHLLLIDIRMPEMSGFELYRRIRERDKKAKVCFTTSFLNYYQSLKANYPEIDSTCLIPKPITIGQLISHIKTELDQR
jgi:DNA-binding response OmpR family regulator